MALLGSKGQLELFKTQPAPVIIPFSAVTVGSDLFNVARDIFFPLERLLIVFKTASSIGTLEGYAHVSETNNITLHSTVAGALLNAPETVVDLSTMVSGNVIISVKGTSAQTSTLTAFYPTLTTTPITIETTLEAYPAAMAGYLVDLPEPAWKIQGQLEAWDLSIQGPVINTSTLGTKWGTRQKSVITGNGSFRFMIDFYSSETEQDIDPLLRLALMSEYGSEAKARFYLKKDTSGEEICITSPKTLNFNSIYYEANIVLTVSAVEIASDTLIRGSAQFETTGKVQLLVG